MIEEKKQTILLLTDVYIREEVENMESGDGRNIYSIHNWVATFNGPSYISKENSVATGPSMEFSRSGKSSNEALDILIVAAQAQGLEFR